MGLEDREDNPRLTRTFLDEAPTTAQAGPRIHTPTPKVTERIRYSKRARLGAGAFGEAWHVVNVDTGGYLAVKFVERPPSNTHLFVMLQREVELMSRVSHVSKLGRFI